MSIKKFKPQLRSDAFWDTCRFWDVGILWSIFWAVFFGILVYSFLFYFEHIFKCISIFFAFVCAVYIYLVLDTYYKRLKQWTDKGFETMTVDTDKRSISFDRLTKFSANDIEHVELLELLKLNKPYLIWYYPVVNVVMKFFLKNGIVQSFKFNNAIQLISAIDTLRSLNIDVKPSEIESKHKNDFCLIYIYFVILAIFLLHVLFKLFIG